MPPRFFQDLYEHLGVSRTATTEEITLAYRRIILLDHPRRNRDCRATIRYYNALSAYETLGNEAARRRYDVYHRIYGASATSPSTPITHTFRSNLNTPSRQIIHSRLLLHLSNHETRWRSTISLEKRKIACLNMQFHQAAHLQLPHGFEHFSTPDSEPLGVFADVTLELLRRLRYLKDKIACAEKVLAEVRALGESLDKENRKSLTKCNFLPCISLDTVIPSQKFDKNKRQEKYLSTRHLQERFR